MGANVLNVPAVAKSVPEFSFVVKTAERDTLFAAKCVSESWAVADFRLLPSPIVSTWL